MTWREAVLLSLRAYSVRHKTRVIRRAAFRQEELVSMLNATGATGKTPWQTMSRVLQELRNEGRIEFLTPGRYLLLDAGIDAEAERLSDAALDVAILAGKLRFGFVNAGDVVIKARRRRGQARLRQLTLTGYGGRCAICDVAARDLLVASHIVRWADAPEHRSDLRNVLSLCRFHDVLFERGNWSLADDYTILARPAAEAEGPVTAAVMAATGQFRLPSRHPPAAALLRLHRLRAGFER